MTKNSREEKHSSIFKPPTTMGQLLAKPKDKIKLENPGYSAYHAETATKHVGSTNRGISARYSELMLSNRNQY